MDHEIELKQTKPYRDSRIIDSDDDGSVDERYIDEYDETDNGAIVPELRTRLRSQNRWLVFAVAVVVLVAAVYLSRSVYHSSDESRSGKYDSRNKQDGSANHQSVGGSTGADGDNHNNNHVVDIDGFNRTKNAKDAAAARWNRTHPNVPMPDACQQKVLKYSQWINVSITKADGVMYDVIEQLPHDPEAFTQGLTYNNGRLYESTGLYGKSTVRILDATTGKLLKKTSMDGKLFGEGMAFVDGLLYQITWKSKRGFVYNATDLSLVKEFGFRTTKNEGWGITYSECSNELIVSDGSENLHFWDPKTLVETRRLPIRRVSGKLAKEINEIEFWRGRVLANVWFEDVLLVIDPLTGIVEKEYDFSELWPKTDRKKVGANVFNGISVSGEKDVLFVTGKLWDRLFRIKLR